jgi:hypothetical protein
LSGQAAKYRFIASFAGEEIARSRAYSGPSFLGAKPTLVSLSPEGDPILVYASKEGGSSSISATVDYGAGQGQAVLRLIGPDGKARIEESSSGIELGGDRYRYDWSLPFGQEDAGKNYNLSLVYVHDTLSGEYPLEEKTISVLPVAIDFGAGEVTPERGKWNETFIYSLPVNSSVDATVHLEVYDPCSHAWAQRGSVKVSAGETLINISAQPLKRECSDAEGEEASYRFTAAFADKAFESEVYSGPMVKGGQPRLMSVDFEPVLLVSRDAPQYQTVKATVDFPQGQDQMQITIVGPDGNLSEEEMKAANLGRNQYLYTWSKEFGIENVGNYTIHLQNAHPSTTGGEIKFTGTMAVVSKPENAEIKSDSQETGGKEPGKFIPPAGVTVVGNVTPAVGVIQAWDEKDPLHALTYTLYLQNWSSSQVPWIELSVRAYGTNQPWRIVGDKKRFNPSAGSVSWTLKPFWETPFLGQGEYRFIIDGAETQAFPGPEIIAVLSKASDSLNGRIHNFQVTANSTQNLTICLVGGDSRLPENIKSWETISQCQDYKNGSGEQPFKWQIPETQAPPYYDFDIKIKEPLP